MRPSSFRRLGATLLLAMFLPGCVDSPVTAPDARRPDSRAAAAAPRVQETTLTDGDFSLVVRHQGRKLHAVSASRGGKPLTQMQWSHRPDGQAARLSARVWAGDGTVRDLPDVRAPGRREADVRTSLAPGASLPLRSAGAYGCWYELSMVFMAVAAVWSAVYGEEWTALAGLLFALEEALTRYFDCLDRYSNSEM